MNAEKGDEITKQFCDKLCREYRKHGAISIHRESKKGSPQNNENNGTESYFHSVIDRLDKSKARLRGFSESVFDHKVGVVF